MKVIVGYDGSAAAEHAVDRALAWAGAGSEIHLVGAFASGVAVHGGAVQLEDERAELGRLLADAARSLSDKGVRVETVSTPGDAGKAIVSTAKDLDADLIVVGSAGKGLAARALLGSVSTYVLHHAPCDVLVVR